MIFRKISVSGRRKHREKLMKSMSMMPKKSSTYSWVMSLRPERNIDCSLPCSQVMPFAPSTGAIHDNIADQFLKKNLDTFEKCLEFLASFKTNKKT